MQFLYFLEILFTSFVKIIRKFFKGLQNKIKKRNILFVADIR